MSKFIKRKETEVLNDDKNKTWSWKTFARDAKMVLRSVQREDRKRAGGWSSIRPEVARGWTQFRRVRFTLVRSNESGDVCVDFNVRADICVGEYEISADAYVRRADESLQVNARKRKRAFKSFEDAFASYRKGFLGKVMDERSLRGTYLTAGFGRWMIRLAKKSL